MSSAAQNTATVLPDCEGSNPRGKFDLLILLIATAAVRGAAAWLLPSQCISIDMSHWRFVAVLLYNGKNPYASGDYHLLNWPPFWMETLYFVMRGALILHLDFYASLRAVLIGADLGVLAVSYKLAGILQPQKRHLKLFLWGYCLNPLLTLLTVVHGNFDAFATFWVILFLIYLIRFRTGGSAIDWLTAAGCLGMGIFTKTFPLLLWPLLVPGARKMSGRARMLGALFLLGPVVLSLGPLFILSPLQVRIGVIGYHSLGLEFGLISLPRLAGVPAENLEWYGYIFSVLLLTGSFVVALLLYNRDIRNDADVVLLAAILLMAVFTVGPGYGGQYWFWVVPLLLLCFSIYRGRLHTALIVCAVVTIITNIFEYGVEDWLGGFLSLGLPSHGLLAFSKYLIESPRLMAWIQLPMTLSALSVLVFGIMALIKPSRWASSSDASPA